MTWSGRATERVTFSYRDVQLKSIIVGQGLTCTSVGADGVVWVFFLSPIISNFFFPLSGRRPDIN